MTSNHEEKVKSQVQTENGAPFKICGACKTEWATFVDFIQDKNIFYTGRNMGANKVLFFFDHHCGNSLGLFGSDLGRIFESYNERGFRIERDRNKKRKQPD